MNKKFSGDVSISRVERVLDDFFKVDKAELRYQRFDGTMSDTVQRLNFDRGDSVAAIIYNRDTKNIILVNQFKYPTYKKGPGWITEAVAGVLKEGENPDDAIRREVLEEIGYEIEKLDFIATFYVSPGGSSERVMLYYGEVVDTGKVAKGGGVDSENEDIRSVEIPLGTLSHSLLSGYVEDAKTLVGLFWLQNKLNTQK